MILVDASLLLHAYNPRSPDHQRAKAWLEAELSGANPVRFAWVTLWAFMRISTNSRAFEHPLSGPEASAIVASWLARPHAGVLEPAERHAELLAGLVADGQAVGPLVVDAALAAIAVEHGATVHTTDRDFARFPGLKWRNPLTP